MFLSIIYYQSLIFFLNFSIRLRGFLLINLSGFFLEFFIRLGSCFHQARNKTTFILINMTICLIGLIFKKKDNYKDIVI